MEMQFKNEIKKLADVVVWADNWIRELKDGLTEEEFAEDEEVKEFETVKKVVFEAMNRHIVYTNALNNDIASKDAKIEKLEKELEGRKECYTALKELVDTKYISIEEHNNIVDPLNKENERLNRYTANVDKVNHDLVTHVTLLEDENKRLSEKIKHQKENLDGINKTLETRTKEKESLINVRNNQDREIEAHEEENKKLEKRIEELKETMMVEEYNSTAKINRLTAEIEKLKVDLIHEREKNEKLAKAHAGLENDMRYTTIIEYQDIIASLNKDIESWKHDVYEELKKNEELEEKIKNLVQEIDYYKNQERIRTDQLRATESKVEELWKEIEKFTKGETKDHGKSGFTEYIKYIIAEEEGKFKAELNKRFSEEVSKISQERTEEALAKAKLNKKFGVGGVVDEFKEGIPCGEDAIE